MTKAEIIEYIDAQMKILREELLIIKGFSEWDWYPSDATVWETELEVAKFAVENKHFAKIDGFTLEQLVTEKELEYEDGSDVAVWELISYWNAVTSGAYLNDFENRIQQETLNPEILEVINYCASRIEHTYNEANEYRHNYLYHKMNEDDYKSYKKIKIPTDNKKVCIFCGSRNSNSKALENEISELVKLFAKSDFDLVYGGKKTGIMGMANEIFDNENKKVIGVLPYQNLKCDQLPDNLYQKIRTRDLFDRKKVMIDLADYILILPGGVGTLDEAFEIITSNRMRFTDTKVAIFNCLGFYDNLIKQLETMIEFGFLGKSIWEQIIIESNPHKLFDELSK